MTNTTTATLCYRLLSGGYPPRHVCAAVRRSYLLTYSLIARVCARQASKETEELWPQRWWWGRRGRIAQHREHGTRQC